MPARVASSTTAYPYASAVPVCLNAAPICQLAHQGLKSVNCITPANPCPPKCTLARRGADRFLSCLGCNFCHPACLRAKSSCLRGTFRQRWQKLRTFFCVACLMMAHAPKAVQGARRPWAAWACGVQLPAACCVRAGLAAVAAACRQTGSAPTALHFTTPPARVGAQGADRAWTRPAPA